MMSIDEQLGYMKSKTNAWAASTQRSEALRLASVADDIDGNPERLWNAIQGRSPYTRQTIWVRVTDAWDWLIRTGRRPHGRNAYADWKKDNAKVFRHAYQRKKPTMSFEEARARILTIQNEGARLHALFLLSNGLRYTESLTLENGHVIGKGGKKREVFGEKSAEHVPYHVLRRELAAVGLKPHDLRKLMATKLVEGGAGEFELCEIMGWQSMQTASLYVRTSRDRMKNLVKKVNE